MIKILPRVPHGLSRLIAVRLFLAGICFCSLISIAQIFINLSAKEAEVKANVVDIVERSLPSISTSVYTIDKEQLGIQLRALLFNPHIRFAQVSEVRGGEKLYFKEGELPHGYDFIVERPLRYKVISDVREDYGQLSVIATYDDAYRELIEESIITFLLSLVVVLLLILVVTRLYQTYIEGPLNRLSEILEDQSVDNLRIPVSLNRSHTSQRPDQFDRLEGALETSRAQYFQDVFQRSIESSEDIDSSSLGPIQWDSDRMNKVLESAVARTNVMEQPFVTMLFQVNNTFDKRSDYVADQLLQIVAKRTLGKLRQSRGIADSGQHSIEVAPAGNNRFIVVIENMGNRVHCISIARRLLELYEKEVLIGARSLTPEVSVGVCICPEDASSQVAILAAAEFALENASASAPQSAFVMYSDIKN